VKARALGEKNERKTDGGRPARGQGRLLHKGGLDNHPGFSGQLFKGLERKVRIRPAGRERGNPFGAGGSAFACRRSGNPEPGKGRPVFGMGIALYI